MCKVIDLYFCISILGVKLKHKLIILPKYLSKLCTSSHKVFKVFTECCYLVNSTSQKLDVIFSLKWPGWSWRVHHYGSHRHVSKCRSHSNLCGFRKKTSL